MILKELVNDRTAHYDRMESSTRSGLKQFKDGFEVWDVPQLLSVDIFGWILSPQIRSQSHLKETIEIAGEPY